jgi:hypothetical protein
MEWNGRGGVTNAQYPESVAAERRSGRKRDEGVASTAQAAPRSLELTRAGGRAEHAETERGETRCDWPSPRAWQAPSPQLRPAKPSDLPTEPPMALLQRRAPPLDPSRGAASDASG